jgi:hypothetical protein
MQRSKCQEDEKIRYERRGFGIFDHLSVCYFERASSCTVHQAVQSIWRMIAYEQEQHPIANITDGFNTTPSTVC